MISGKVGSTRLRAADKYCNARSGYNIPLNILEHPRGDSDQNNAPALCSCPPWTWATAWCAHFCASSHGDVGTAIVELSWIQFFAKSYTIKNHRHRIQEIRWMKRQSLNAMRSTHFFRFEACVKMIDHTGGSIYIYIYYMSVMIFDLKQCSIAANCTKMFAEIFTHAPTWTSSKHLSVWQYISAYHSLYHKISFRTRPFWGFERCGKQFCLCLLEAFDYNHLISW